MKDLREQGRELYLRLLSYVRPHAKVFALAVVGMIGFRHFLIPDSVLGFFFSFEPNSHYFSPCY